MPLFPLPDVWLFPFFVMPLHVFEPRYRQMIEDSLDGPGRLVLGTIQAGHEHEAAGNPPIHRLAGLGEIGRHERLPDGRFHVLLVGLQRVFVREVTSDRLYRKVAVQPAQEIPLAEEREGPVRESLLAALEQRLPEPSDIPPEVTISHLIDMLLLRLELPHRTVNRLYAELDVEKRARGALAQHRRRPPEAE